LGDVLHNLPIVWDIRQFYPQARIDWAIDEAYVDLIHPLLSNDSFRGIDQIIPLGFRRLKKDIREQGLQKALQEFVSQKALLQQQSYDLVIETQGLLKSALVTFLAKKSPQAIVAGIGNRTQDSGYEPLARMFYTKSIKVPLHYHAIDRSRAVTAGGLNTAIPDRSLSPPKFYPPNYVEHLQLLPNPLGLKKGSYVVGFHATARAAKCWSNDHWVAVGKELANRGMVVVFPWGNAKEKAISESLAKEVPGAIVPKAFSIKEAFTINAQAKLVIGVDTGLTHLAAVLGTPTIELYVDSPIWKTEGYWSNSVINLGDTQQAPKLDEVMESITRLMSKIEMN
jgi:heptosyltransferase I